MDLDINKAVGAAQDAVSLLRTQSAQSQKTIMQRRLLTTLSIRLRRK